jgi:hypothetical protein
VFWVRCNPVSAESLTGLYALRGKCYTPCRGLGNNLAPAGEVLEDSPVRVLHLGKIRHARVWIEELPDAAYPAIKVLTHTIAAGAASRNILRLAAIEVFVPLGPRWMYGLLGGQFSQDSTGQLIVDVGVSTPNGRSFPDSLAMKGEEVRVGLPAEYAQSVLAGVDLAETELKTLAPGKLSISCATHGTIGSSQAIYKHLSATLVKFFNTASLESSDDELAKLFPGTFS